MAKGLKIILLEQVGEQNEDPHMEDDGTQLWPEGELATNQYNYSSNETHRLVTRITPTAERLSSDSST